VSGVTDPQLLARTAESIWQQIGRQEIEGSFETDDIWSYESEALDADLLRMRSGDPVELLIASPQASEVAEDIVSATELSGLPRAARARYLESIGWEREVAERFAELQDSIGQQTIFRTQNSRISYDSEQGLRVVVDFINFLVVRELDATAAPPQEATASPTLEERLAGRTDEAANALRRVSGTRRLLTTLRDGGAIDEENYQRRMTELLSVERRRVQELDEG